MPKVTILEVIWECLGSQFLCVFADVYVLLLVTALSISLYLLLEFSSISYGLDTLLGDYFPNTFATLLMFSRGCFIFLGVSECRILYIYMCVPQVFSACA